MIGNVRYTLLLLILALGSLAVQPVQASDLPDSAYISGVTGHAQTYILSCEARSAVDWAAFWGVKIKETDFLAELPRSDNPDLGFVGKPTDPWGTIPPLSYGVHARPVADVLRQHGLKARAERGLEWDDLRGEIAAGRPVIVWIVGQMWPGAPVSYTDAHGKTTTVAPFEHTMILIGYDASLVYVVDAYTGQNQTYYVQTFLTSWKALGNMAILGRKQKAPKSKAPEPTPPPTPQIRGGGYTAFLPHVQSAPIPPAEKPGKRPPRAQPGSDLPETYTVQRGDFLLGVAHRFGLDWLHLARLNDIRFPYIIYPGQVLRLR